MYPSDDPGHTAHHGNISQLDAGVGAVLDCPEELNLAKNTFVFVTSDDGPAITGMHPHGSAGPLPAKNGAIHDGGTRVPGVVRWPGHTQRGKTSGELIFGLDVVPTLCELAGTARLADRILDGTSFLPALEGKNITSASAVLAVQSSQSRCEGGDSRWQLKTGLDTPELTPRGGSPADEMQLIRTAGLTNLRLYNLQSDIAKSTDISEQHADVLIALSSRMGQFYGEVQATAPHWPTSLWPRHESKLIQWPQYRINRSKNK